MDAALNWVGAAAQFEVIVKVLIVVLLLGGAMALFEVIRYVRALRRDRDLNHRLILRRIAEETPNDPRFAAPAQYAPAPRPGLLRRAVRGTLSAVGIVALLVLFSAALVVPFLGGWLEHRDYLEKADYIVPLPGDSRRLIKAAELYKQGYAPRILLSGVAVSDRIQELRLDAGYPTIDAEELQLRTLEKAGVPRASTVSIGANDASIADTAGALKRYAGERKLKVIVVASGHQALRTKLTFEEASPRLRVLVVPEGDAAAEPWWSNRDVALDTLAEATRVAHVWLGSHLRAMQTEPDAPAVAAQPPPAAKPVENLGAAPARKASDNAITSR